MCDKILRQKNKQRQPRTTTETKNKKKFEENLKKISIQVHIGYKSGTFQVYVHFVKRTQKKIRQ